MLFRAQVPLFVRLLFLLT